MHKFVFYIGSLGLYEVIQAANMYDARQKLRSGSLYRFYSQAVLISESEPCYRASD